MIEEKLKVGILITGTPHERSINKVIEEIVYYIHSYALDIFLGPEWLLLPKDKLFSKQEKNEVINKIITKTKRKDVLIIPGTMMWEDENFFYNTTPIISGNNLLIEYHKIGNPNIGDASSQNRAYERGCNKRRFEQDKDTALERGVFSWREYSIGVEIGFDHGTLYNLLESTDKPFLDLYFLTSCMNGRNIRKEWTPVKDLGYGLCSDGNSKESTVFQKVKEGFRDVEPVAVFKNSNICPQLEILLKNLQVYELFMKK